jgi:hypothetical protein
MTILIFVVLATFVFTIWPLKKAAEWIGAGKTGYGSVIYALVLLFLVSILFVFLIIPFAFAGTAGLIAFIVLGIYITGKVYSVVLETSFWGGIAIAVVAGIIGTILNLIFVLIFGISLDLKNIDHAGIAQQSGDFEQKRMIEDNLPLQEGDELDGEAQKSTIDASPQEKGGSATPIEAKKVEDLKKGNVSPQSPRKKHWGYQTISKTDLPRYLDYKVKLTMENGMVRTGRLRSVNNSQATIDHSLRGGAISYHLPLKNVAKVEVSVLME